MKNVIYLTSLLALTAGIGCGKPPTSQARAIPMATLVASYTDTKSLVLRGPNETQKLKKLLHDRTASLEALSQLQSGVPDSARIRAVNFLVDAMSDPSNPNRGLVQSDVENFITTASNDEELASDKVDLFSRLTALNPKRARELLHKNTNGPNGRIMKYAFNFQKRRIK